VNVDYVDFEDLIMVDISPLFCTTGKIQLMYGKMLP